ncbi:MAG: hypothetical protein ACRDRR_06140 [Pseudonocardiaceae bacterium]
MSVWPKVLDAAFELDDDWGTLVWLVMTTGVRRGEICALRWSRVDLDAAVIDFRRSYRLRRGIGDREGHQDPSDAPHRLGHRDRGAAARA